MLLFGREPDLPVDIQDRLQYAWKKAGKHFQKAVQQWKVNHDQKMYAPCISVGDLVYLQKWVQGRNNIQDAWEPTKFFVAATPTKDGRPFMVQ